jgi:hypothetical protein
VHLFNFVCFVEHCVFLCFYLYYTYIVHPLGVQVNRQYLIFTSYLQATRKPVTDGRFRLDIRWR